MKNIIAEKSENIQNTFGNPSKSFEYLCHHCSNIIQNHKEFTCSNNFCSKKYCFSCLASFYQKKTDSNDSIKNNIFSVWKCPSCEGKCLCNKCISKNSSSTTEAEEQHKSNDFLGKKISSDAELIMWLSNGENKSIDAQNVKFPFVPLNSKIKSKLFDKLIKIAKQCELFYRHKCKNEYIKKNCSNCFETNFHQNDLLRFFNYETFLYYMKYLFLISNKIVAYSKENFNKNKSDFEELFKKFKKKEEIWAFKDTKIICKQCMYFLINKPNFFKNIKDIFLKKEKKIFLLDNSIELNINKKNDNIDYIKNNNKDTKNIINNETKNIDYMLTSKKVFSVNKIPKKKYQNNIKKEVSNNIIINYNNHNSNIINNLIFKNELKINNNSIFDVNSISNSIHYPFINNFLMNYNIYNLNKSSSIDNNYIQSLFFGLKNNMTAILGMVELCKKDNDKEKHFYEIILLNEKIIYYFKLIEEAVLSNMNLLNKLLFKINIVSKENTDNIENIETKKKLTGLIADNKNFLSLINNLNFNYSNIEDIFIKNLFL